MKLIKREILLWLRLIYYSYHLEGAKPVSLLENLNSPSRWYIPGGAVYPSEINKHFEKYKKFLIKLINKKNISVIYIIAPVKNQELCRYISGSCCGESNITDILKKLEIKKCDEINKPS